MKALIAAAMLGGVLATPASAEGAKFACDQKYAGSDFAAAIAACSEIVTADPYNMNATYWRALAYRDGGKPDQALADFTKVADSDNAARADAAINMSVIDANRGDVKGSLAVLEKYTYLYDPGTASAGEMAVAYNNLCYAHMQLGELNQALEDCNASLKYGDVPDAHIKHDELMKRLGLQ